MELDGEDRQVVEDALKAAAIELRVELDLDRNAGPIRSALQQVYAALYIIKQNS